MYASLYNYGQNSQNTLFKDGQGRLITNPDSTDDPTVACTFETDKSYALVLYSPPNASSLATAPFPEMAYVLSENVLTCRLSFYGPHTVGSGSYGFSDYIAIKSFDLTNPSDPRLIECPREHQQTLDYMGAKYKWVLGCAKNSAPASHSKMYLSALRRLEDTVSQVQELGLGQGFVSKAMSAVVRGVWGVSRPATGRPTPHES